MIKFGNDIVTVGGDWLKVIPKAVKIAEYPLQQITIPANYGYREIFSNVQITESNYAVLKVDCTEINGALLMALFASSTIVTIDVASGSRQQLNFTDANLRNLVAYDGTVSGKVITLSNWHIINRIIFDFVERKVHFYDTNNVIIADANMAGGTTRYTPLGIRLIDPDSSNQTICKVAGTIWQCFTMEQALSV